MGKKKKPVVELRYYEIPQNEPVLALLGENWIRSYGQDITNEHFHNLMEVGYCRDGEGMIGLNGQNFPYEAGMVSILPANYPHTTNSRNGTKSYWEYFYFEPEHVLAKLYEENVAAKEQMLRLLNERPVLKNPGNAAGMHMIIRQILEEMRLKEPLYRVSVRGLLTALVVEIARDNSKHSKEQGKSLREEGSSGLSLIHNAFDYIDKYYMEKIRVEDLADTCGLSETHFRRLFIASMHMPPMEYVNLVRVQMACELMKKTNYSMDEVAQRVGFVTTSTFNRNFKKIVATSPYQWKKNPDNYESGLLNFKISALKGWE